MSGWGGRTDGRLPLWLLGSLARVREEVIPYPEDQSLVLARDLTEYQPADPVWRLDLCPDRILSPGEILAAVGSRQTEIAHHRGNDERRRDLGTKRINHLHNSVFQYPFQGWRIDSQHGHRLRVIVPEAEFRDVIYRRAEQFGLNRN